MINGLRQAGVEVVECNVKLWKGIEDRVSAASGGWANPRFITRVIKTYVLLLRQYRAVGHYDIMIVGYPGQFDVYLARVLTWLRRKPLAWDILMSIYLVAVERDLERRSRFTVNLIRRIEYWAFRLPDRLISDTREYVRWFGQFYAVDPARFCIAPIGTDEQVFRPLAVARPPDQPFTLLYYGTFIRNHGVPTIIEAARLLRDYPDIRFVLIGDGPDKNISTALARKYGLSNVEFIDWVEQSELPGHIAAADVCLGVFSTTQQSLITVHNKIYEALAMRKPLITGDSAAVRDNFVDGEHLMLVERANPQALAEAIVRLQHDPALRERLAAQGYQFFCEHFTSSKLGEGLRAHLEALAAKRK